MQSGEQARRGVRRVRLAVVLALCAICFGAIGRMMYLDAYYFGHAPRVPDPQSGAVVRVVIHHGTQVFLTEHQWLWFDSPTARAIQNLVFLFSVAAALFLARRWRLFDEGDR